MSLFVLLDGVGPDRCFRGRHAAERLHAGVEIAELLCVVQVLLAREQSAVADMVVRVGLLINQA